MDLFENKLKDSESLFLDEIALDTEYIPKILKFRENEQKYIATCINPLLQERNGRNLVITGAPGIGKSAATRWVLRELEEKYSSDEIQPLFINCWKKDTAYKIALEICEQIGYKFVQNRNTDELLKEITKILNKTTAVIVLDEADKLDKESHSLIYSLLEDIYKKSIILITNEKQWLIELDQRIKSRLTPDLLEFKPYNLKEIDGILKQRIDHAFVPDVFDKNALDIITNKTYESSDIRVGLFLLRESGNNAESEASKRVLEKHAESAVQKLKEFKIQDSSNIEGEEKQILEIIKNNSGKTIAELFEIYEKQGGEKTYRTFSRKLVDLEKGKMVSLKMIKKGKGGKSTFVEYGSSKKLDEF